MRAVQSKRQIPLLVLQDAAVIHGPDHRTEVIGQEVCQAVSVAHRDHLSGDGEIQHVLCFGKG